MVRDVRRDLRGHDLMLLAAGVTFYAALAVVPLAVVSLRLAGWLGGDGAVRSFARVVSVFLPHTDVSDAGQALAAAALRVPWPVLVASVLPASLYAEGLRRALARLAPGRTETGLRQAVRGRVLAIGGFLFVTVTLLAVATVGASLTGGSCRSPWASTWRSSAAGPSRPQPWWSRTGSASRARCGRAP